VPSVVCALLLAVSVKVLVVLALVVLVGLKVPFTPVGRSLTDKVTVALKLFWGVTVIVLVAVPLWLR